ncbi:unnamed protein product, partial [Rotaria magnacalcarata]
MNVETAFVEETRVVFVSFATVQLTEFGRTGSSPVEPQRFWYYRIVR